ncbi:unnamed protein product [Allacma fusca]|uniref:Uncharacterized protein n=1 Tax=Allacma fusca TaxID=39272 RepID=A0A8J2PCB8_9HEXA|nr:unnamed protein product [Allacma fusca]
MYSIEHWMVIFPNICPGRNVVTSWILIVKLRRTGRFAGIRGVRSPLLHVTPMLGPNGHYVQSAACHFFMNHNVFVAYATTVLR